MSEIKLGLATGYISRGLNVLTTVILTRLLSPDLFGAYGLIQSSAQSASTLFRLGANYSYTVLLPSIRDDQDRARFSASYVGLGLASSIPFGLSIGFMSIGAIRQTVQDYSIGNLWIIIAMSTMLIIFSDCLSELTWSVLFPYKDTMKYVLIRDPVVSGLKLFMPILLYLLGGFTGLIVGLGFVGVTSLVWSLVAGNAKLFKSVGNITKNLSRKDTGLLLRYGSVNYIVPLLSNLVLLPVLIDIGKYGNIADVGSIRIGAWGAQLITAFGGSLAPILLVRNSRAQANNSGISDLVKSCFVIYQFFLLIIIGGWWMVNIYLFEGKFESSYGLQIAVIIGSVSQSALQLLMQRRLTPREQLLVNSVQCISLIISYLFITQTIPGEKAYQYALIPYISSTLSICSAITIRSVRRALGLDNNSVLILIMSVLGQAGVLAFSSNAAGLLSLGISSLAGLYIFSHKRVSAIT